MARAQITVRLATMPHDCMHSGSGLYKFRNLLIGQSTTLPWSRSAICQGRKRLKQILTAPCRKWTLGAQN